MKPEFDPSEPPFRFRAIRSEVPAALAAIPDDVVLAAFAARWPSWAVPRPRWTADSIRRRSWLCQKNRPAALAVYETAADLADREGVSVRTIQRRIRSGAIEGRVVEGSTTYVRSDEPPEEIWLIVPHCLLPDPRLREHPGPHKPYAPRGIGPVRRSQ